MGYPIALKRASTYAMNARQRESMYASGGSISGNIISQGYWKQYGKMETFGNNREDAGDFYRNGQLLLPVGLIMPFAGTEIPNGWLRCDGSEISKAQYPRLFASVGGTYGTPSNANNFLLPDLRGRTLIGTGDGPGLTNRVLAATGGAETVALTADEMPAHTHTGTTDSAGDHNHTVSNTVQKTGLNTPGSLDNDSGAGGTEIDNIATATITTSTAGAHTHSFTTNSTGSGSAHNNMQPFMALNYIIRY